jgi:hypothetical protein
MAVKNIVAGILLIIIISAFLPTAHSQNQESLSITTYYPSPNGVFRDLEIRSKLAVGNITNSGNTTYDSMAELGNAQMYVNSIILGNVTVTPGTACPANEAGTLRFNRNFRKLQFCDGNNWLNASAQ